MTKTFRRLGLAACAAIAAGGAAAETSPWYIGGYLGYAHLSNVLGLADDEEVPTGSAYSSKSDNVTTIALVGGLDQPIGRQRLFGSATLRHNKYAHNSALDNNGHTLSAGLDWQTVEHLSGNLTLKSDRDLIHYGTFERPGSVANISTSRLADFTAHLGGVTRLTFDFGANHRAVDYSDPGYAGREYSQNQIMLGARYKPGGYSTIGLALRDADGRFPNYRNGVGDKYNRRDVDLSASFEFSGLTNVYARLSHTRLDYEQQNNLDFSGATGLLRGTWLPTGKLKLAAELARDRGQDLRFALDLFGSQLETSGIANTMRVRADYDATAKIKLHATAGNTRRDVAVTTLFGFQEEGRERTTNLGLGATWTPTRTSLVGCDLTRLRQRSDLTATGRLNVTSNTTSCYAQLTLQP